MTQEDGSQHWTTEPPVKKKLSEPPRRALPLPPVVEEQQFATLTPEIIKKIFRGRSNPSRRQKSILGIQDRVDLNWEHELSGRKVTIVELLDLAINPEPIVIRDNPTGQSHDDIIEKSGGGEGGLTYADRDENLKAIGFRTYSDYLDSEFWKGLRLKVFEKKGRQCCKCRKNANQVHHSNYSVNTLLGSTFAHLWPVCGDCHNMAEVRQNGTKRSIKEANIALGISRRPGRKKTGKRNKKNQKLR